MRLRSICLLLICLLPLSLAQAGGPEQTLARLTEGLKVLAGDFEQKVYDANEQLREQSSGTLALSAPRQFRWEYRQPFEQLILADGNRVWVFDPDLEQVTVRQQGLEEQGNPLLALVDPDEMARQFQVTDGGQRDGLDWLVLTPRQTDGAQIESAWLGVADGELKRMHLEDQLGQRTEIAFSDWQRNPALAAGTFRFDPPPGVDVVGDMGEDAEVFPIAD
jgi:outer membrane lipoprotein carrier protein